jgi:hypothetical protein
MGEPVDQPETSRLSRRTFLRGVGVAGAGTAVATVLPSGVAAAATKSRYVTVYRLSHEGEQACGACDQHDFNRYYRKARFARHNRAHLRCNCDIITQNLTQGNWEKFFVRPGGTLRKVWDLRWQQAEEG